MLGTDDQERVAQATDRVAGDRLPAVRELLTTIARRAAAGVDDPCGASAASTATVLSVGAKPGSTCSGSHGLSSSRSPMQ